VTFGAGEKEDIGDGVTVDDDGAPDESLDAGALEEEDGFAAVAECGWPVVRDAFGGADEALGESAVRIRGAKRECERRGGGEENGGRDA
jgi:hypothetical protein